MAEKPLTPTQRSILAAWAQGHTARKIAIDHDVNESQITAVIADLGAGNRERARDMVATPRAEAARSTLEQLLAAGEQHSQKRIQDLAHRARTLLDTLAQVLDEEDRTRAARARVAQLEADLAAARAELGTPAKVSASESKKIRDWARRKGLEVSVRGVLPAHIIDAYHQADGETQ